MQNAMEMCNAMRHKRKRRQSVWERDIGGKREKREKERARDRRKKRENRVWNVRFVLDLWNVNQIIATWYFLFNMGKKCWFCRWIMDFSLAQQQHKNKEKKKCAMWFNAIQKSNSKRLHFFYLIVSQNRKKIVFFLNQQLIQ